MMPLLGQFQELIPDFFIGRHFRPPEQFGASLPVKGGGAGPDRVL
jgi:hypothetical protein